MHLAKWIAYRLLWHQCATNTPPIRHQYATIFHQYATNMPPICNYIPPICDQYATNMSLICHPMYHQYATIFHQYVTNMLPIFHQHVTNMPPICYQYVLNPSSSNRLPLSFSNYRWLLTLSPFLLLFCLCTFVLPSIHTSPHPYRIMISLSR